MNQLPILIIILPLLLVPILLLIRKNEQVYILSIIISFINLILVCLLFYHVQHSGPLFYELGNWKAPIGIRLNADLLSCYFLLLINLMSFICLISGKELVNRQIEKENIYLFYIAWLLCNIGFAGIILTNDIFNLFVFLEISSLSSYFLISQGNYKGSMIAAIQYLFIGSIGAVFILLGIGILYVHTGTLNMSDISDNIINAKISLSIIFAIGLFFLGIGIKSAIFPLHGWLIRTYAYSPSVIVAYFSGTSTKIGIYILIRVFLDILNNINPFEYYSLAQLILFLSLVGALFSTIYAIKQTEIKKMFAFSSVAQISYILIAIMILTPEGIAASLIHVFNHSIIKTGLFLIIAILFVNNQNIKLDDLSGLGKNHPFFMSAFVVLSLGLIGLPLTSGFISKWYIIQSLIHSDYWYISIVVLITSFMTLIYMWKIIEKIYFSESVNNNVITILNHQVIGVFVLMALTIYLGLDASFTTGVSGEIATSLLGSEIK